MSLKKAILLSLGFGSAFALAACGSDGGKNTPDSSGTGGAGGGGGTDCKHIDFSQYTGGAPVSFKTDVMPIFGFSCTASECHNPRDKKAELDLGPKCKYDAPTKTCNYPDVADPDPTKPQPLDQATIDAVYANLIIATKTIPSVQRVQPNDPEHSFLVQKLADTENDQGYQGCTNQDTSKSSFACGTFMPLTGIALCDDNRAKFDKIALWIAQGAQKN